MAYSGLRENLPPGWRSQCESSCALRRSAPVLALGASAIVDREDVIPRGVALEGGGVDHLGMPVDPGNLLMRIDNLIWRATELQAAEGIIAAF